MEKQAYTERSRMYAAQHYVEPARRRGDKTVQITAGDVHKALGFKQRVPAVCQALQSRKFIEENRLTLEKIEGPPSGQSTRVKFSYRLNDGGRPGEEKPVDDAFLKLRGIAKDTFRQLGGGEAFIRKERARFYGSSEGR
ncbi:MAG: hypothetical protein ABSG41_18435 [Bryobacteraceae bacterium]